MSIISIALVNELGYEFLKRVKQTTPQQIVNN